MQPISERGREETRRDKMKEDRRKEPVVVRLTWVGWGEGVRGVPDGRCTMYP